MHYIWPIVPKVISFSHLFLPLQLFLFSPVTVWKPHTDRGEKEQLILVEETVKYTEPIALSDVSTQRIKVTVNQRTPMRCQYCNLKIDLPF